MSQGDISGEDLERLTGQLPDYRLEEMIGRGGMGVVYRAEQLNLGRKVALKLIAPQLAQEPAFRDRFRRESRLAAAIDHPNIIPVYEADTVGDLLFIAMRYVDGTDLRTVIQQTGGLQPRRAAQIVGQIAAALDAAHARKLVHRDVKPANVLLSGAPPNEHAYLTDFGLTKHMTSDSALTETGQWVGTLDFVAPEQIMGRQIDGRADIYSLGCVFFEALTGRPPFPRDADVAKIYAHLNEPPPRVTEQLPELSPEFDVVVARALAKEPDDRYQSAGEFRDAVLGLVSAAQRSAVASEAAPAPVTPTTLPERPPQPPAAAPVVDPAPPPPLQTPASDRPPRKVALWILVAVLLLAGAGAAVAAATGVFDGDENDGAKAPTTLTEATRTTPAKRKKPKTRTVTVPAPTTPAVSPPPEASLASFQTGTDAGQSLPATYCELTPDETRLYCWTPNDGYTITLGRRDPYQPRQSLELPADKGANKGRAPSGYSQLAIGERVSGSGFTCASQADGLKCENSKGHGWRLPRYKGYPVTF